MEFARYAPAHADAYPVGGFDFAVHCWERRWGATLNALSANNQDAIQDHLVDLGYEADRARRVARVARVYVGMKHEIKEG